ncbi:MAG TPA: UbiA family prenyltransferase [Candidatus Glassbacteria bacterium]|nr:UbiA family prenyltransferase [Candidatus Glassbacteria bacterium]
MHKTSGIIHLIRPINCVMMGFAVFVGSILSNPVFASINWINILFGFGTGFMLTAAAMIINDYYDRTIDAINEPSRPIPSGLISTREALLLFFVVSMIGFVFAYFTSVLCLLVACISWIIVVVYVTVGKKSGLPGNFLVSTCVAIPFIYGSIIVLDIIVSSVLIFAFMAFLSNTGREITKGIVDVKGDKTEGVKTIATIFGSKSAAYVAVLFYLLAVFLTPIPIILGLVSIWFIPLIIVTDVAFLVFSFLLLKDYSRKNAKKIKNFILLCFILGLLSFLVGVIT